MKEQLDALDSVLGVDRSTNSDNFLDRMEVLPFRATIPRKRDDVIENNSAVVTVGPPNYRDNDDSRMSDVSMYALYYTICRNCLISYILDNTFSVITSTAKGTEQCS